MERSIGADFSTVTVAESDSASKLGAEAYTAGDQIRFAPGQLDTTSRSGLATLGHELTHVKQQRSSTVTPTFQAKGAKINDDEGLEKEADSKGEQAAAAVGVSMAMMPATAPDPIVVDEKGTQEEDDVMPDGTVVQAKGVTKKDLVLDGGGAPGWIAEKRGSLYVQLIDAVSTYEKLKEPFYDDMLAGLAQVIGLGKSWVTKREKAFFKRKAESGRADAIKKLVQNAEAELVQRSKQKADFDDYTKRAQLGKLNGGDKGKVDYREVIKDDSQGETWKDTADKAFTGVTTTADIASAGTGLVKAANNLGQLSELADLTSSAGPVASAVLAPVDMLNQGRKAELNRRTKNYMKEATNKQLEGMNEGERAMMLADLDMLTPEQFALQYPALDRQLLKATTEMGAKAGKAQKKRSAMAVLAAITAGCFIVALSIGTGGILPGILVGIGIAAAGIKTLMKIPGMLRAGKKMWDGSKGEQRSEAARAILEGALNKEPAALELLRKYEIIREDARLGEADRRALEDSDHYLLMHAKLTDRFKG